MDETWFQVRGRISLFRGDVKEECAKVVDKLFEGMVDMPTTITQIVEHQLRMYHYIFPISMVSVLLFFSHRKCRKLINSNL
jgi:hypothetical protein